MNSRKEFDSSPRVSSVGSYQDVSRERSKKGRRFHAGKFGRAGASSRRRFGS